MTLKNKKKKFMFDVYGKTHSGGDLGLFSSDKINMCIEFINDRLTAEIVDYTSFFISAVGKGTAKCCNMIYAIMTDGFADNEISSSLGCDNLARRKCIKYSERSSVYVFVS